MSMQQRLGETLRRLLQSAALADSLTAALLAAGVASGFFSLFGLDGLLLMSVLIAFAISLLLMPVIRYWRLVLPLTAVSAVFVIIFLWQLELLETVGRQLADFALWAVTWLKIGQPDPADITWFAWLRILMILLAVAIWLPLVRKAGHLVLHIALIALIFTPLLITFPDTLSSLLVTLSGLILLLPRRFIAEVHREKPQEGQLARAPLQFLALPAAIVCLLLAQAVVPDNTRNWRWPALVNRINDIGDLIVSQSGQSRSWQPFSISAYGFRTEGSQLGGPAVLSRQTTLRVQTDQPYLLRGTSLSFYTGSSWERQSSGQYRFGSDLWWQLRQRTFVLSLPGGAAGRAFREKYSRTVTLVIETRTGGMATLFSAGRTRWVSLAQNIDFPAYFNGSGDLFVYGGLPRSFSYTVESEYFDRGLPDFDTSLLELEQKISGGSDNNWSAILAEYLQLPPDLPASVANTALAATEGSASPYQKAQELEAYFKKGFAYTLTPEGETAETDFVAGFLETRSGYCVHYATAMVIMARTLGIPARYVEGFTLIPATGSITGGNWLAAGNTAHAWAELYFEGIGWLTFDPTPGTSANDPETPTPSGSVTPSITPAISPGQEITPTPVPDGNESRDPYSSWYWLLLVPVLLALAWQILPRLAMRRHRRLFDEHLIRQRLPSPGAQLEFYYQDLLRQLACLDIRPETGETLLDFAATAEHRLRLEGLDLSEVIWPVIRWRYGAVVPGSDELKLLDELHNRVEDRLQASLGRLAYLFARVFKAWNLF